MSKKLIAGLLMLVGSLIAQEAFAQITTIGDAINKAGRQRMLSQRMAKVYIQVGHGIDPERSKKILDDSVALFDRNSVELKVYAPTPEIRDVYSRLEQKWVAYKEVLVGIAPTLDSGTRAVALSADVLELANVGTLLLEQHSAKASGKLVNLSGRQRMLSQRMAMFYQAQAWGLKVPQATTELEKSRQEFITAMKTLQSASETTADIKAELLAAEAQWAFFDSALSNRAAGERKALLNVATTSERILEVMDKVTGMYARLNS